MAKVKSIKDIEKALEAKRLERIANRKAKFLSTDRGISSHFMNLDAQALNTIISEIESVTDSQVFTGFIYSTNTEAMVAICNALQYMKGPLRPQISDSIWNTFTKDIRTKVITAYGRLPYTAKEVLIEIDGDIINIDPEAQQRAKDGIVGNPEELEALLYELSIALDLASDLKCTKAELDLAWNSALSKMRRESIMENYKDKLQA